MDVLEAAGSKWNFIPFKPGMVGGHCIGIDPYYLTHKAEQVGYQPELILAGRRLNDNMAKYTVESIMKKISRKNISVSQATVGVMGVTFKENCPDVRNSKVFDLINEFQSWGIKVIAADPIVDSCEVSALYGVDVFKRLENHSCDALVVAVGHKEYREMSVRELAILFRNPKNAVIGDLKSLYNRDDLIETGLDLFRL